MRGRKFALVLGLALALTASRAAAQIDANGWYNIALAASHNETQQVQALLVEGGHDPDAIDSRSGRTGLDYAASFNNTEMAQILLDHRAHVDARDSFGNTALHWAAERGNLDVMRLLIDNKATVDFINRQGITPVMVAAEHAQPAAVRLLVASGADPRKQDYTGRDAFGWAAGKPAIVQALNAKR
jgi:ankyrin repeat protein